MLRIPINRAPVHPGEVLREEFLQPMGISQVELAKLLDIPFQVST
jgi:plasmid maintenance system antidote protein VapI